VQGAVPQLGLQRLPIVDVLDVHDQVSRPSLGLRHGRGADEHPDDRVVGAHEPALVPQDPRYARLHERAVALRLRQVVGVGDFEECAALQALRRAQEQVAECGVAGDDDAVWGEQGHPDRGVVERAAEAVPKQVVGLGRRHRRCPMLA
jgi:hypothetical protein